MSGAPVAPAAAPRWSPARHWRGEVRLIVSLCIGAAALLLWSTLVDGLATVAAVRGSHLQALAIGWLIAWPILWLVASWFAVGVWRAARSGPWRGRGAIGTLLALAVALLIVAGVLASALGSARTSAVVDGQSGPPYRPAGCAADCRSPRTARCSRSSARSAPATATRVRSALAAQPRLQRVEPELAGRPPGRSGTGGAGDRRPRPRDPRRRGLRAGLHGRLPGRAIAPTAARGPARIPAPRGAQRQPGVAALGEERAARAWRAGGI